MAQSSPALTDVSVGALPPRRAISADDGRPKQWTVDLRQREGEKFGAVAVRSQDRFSRLFIRPKEGGAGSPGQAGQTSEGSLSAASTPVFANKY